jgi:hypothetical protein
MNISVLIPTRYRIERLAQAIGSLLDTAAHPDKVEFVLRMHSDDSETVSAIPKLLRMATVQVIVGRPLGYEGDPVYFWEMSNIASGRWLLGFNDDVIMERSSAGWDVHPDLVDERTIYIPAVSKFNESVYVNDSNCPFNILPNRWWTHIGATQFEFPTDKTMYSRLRAAGWKTQFLTGMAIHHKHMADDKLMKEENRS